MSGPNFIQQDVADFVHQSPTLSPSLLLSKYGQIGETEVKNHKGKWERHPLKPEAVRAVCKAVALPLKAPPVWSGRADAHLLYLTLKSRLMVNMAGGVLENANLCLHPFTGQPRIPGSAVKGVTRHAAWRMWKEEKNPAVKTGMARAIADIFGYPTQDKELDAALAREVSNIEANTHLAGSVIFLDAHPLDRAPLVEEVLTPHTNNRPNPQTFPAVEAGATFVFAMLPGRRMATFAADTRETYWTLAQSWLREALCEDGVGAKTAAGYGWFQENTQIADRMKKEAEAKREQVQQDRQEAARLDAMSPVDRFKEEFLTMDSEPFANAVKGSAELEPDQQKALLLAVSDASKKDWWKGKKKRAKKDDKDKAMVEALLALAKTHGVELS